MNRKRVAKIGMAVCFLLGMFLLPVNQLKAQAAQVIATVEGTIGAKTTSSLLYLSTAQGDMEIRLDADTDTSACRVLLAGKKITVDVTGGTDGYLHAAKLSSNGQVSNVSIDPSATAVVTGTLDKKTTESVLYVKTAQGDMEIKFDSSTDMSDCKVLVAGQTYTITCARGSDAYMHALKISGGAVGSTAAAVSWLSPAPADPGSAIAPTMSVAGKVKSSTTDSKLYLSTNEGEMQFIIENNTDARQGMVLTPNNQVAVAFYHGSDGYLHATMIVGVKTSISTATVDTSNTVTVTGTVGSKSNEEILYLDTAQGEMQLKLDAVKSTSGFKVLLSGTKLNVTVAGGSDSYMHAIEITGA